MVTSSTKRLIVVCEIENRDHFYITKRSRLHEMKDSIYTVKNMQEQDDTREKNLSIAQYIPFDHLGGMSQHIRFPTPHCEMHVRQRQTSRIILGTVIS